MPNALIVLVNNLAAQSMPEHRRATRFLGRVYIDRIGPTSRSLNGFTSTIMMVDEYSHMVWIENMKSGQELCPVVEELLRQKESMESGARFDVFEETVSLSTTTWPKW